jgi:tetratricopeptide (TPR) repeat protein
MSLFAVLPRSPAIRPVASPIAVLILSFIFFSFAFAQHRLPYLDGANNSPLAQPDFDEIYREQVMLNTTERNRITESQEQFEAGTVSALDMNAPQKAVKNLRKATVLLKEQKAKEAVRYLQEAIKIYPKFVSAHIVLGLAYFDLQDKRAREEFETATHLDDQFPASFLYLGMLSLWSNDFAGADVSLEKAAFLSPNDPQILNVLAFAQNGTHKYTDVLRTVNHLHQLDHHGMADVHYIAAAAAFSLHEVDSGKAELSTFLREEPSGPLSAVARQKLEELSQGKVPFAQNSATIVAVPTETRVQTYPNTARLKSELNGVAEGPYSSDDSADALESTSAAAVEPREIARIPAEDSSHTFTIHQAVDETALFLAVSEHGKMVDNLSLSNISIRDDDKPPARILQFLPQSQLPLRLGVLIDTSGSVEHRISFEKSAAKTFLKTVLNSQSDLAFVAGFDTEVSVTQDFTSDSAALGQGVDKMERKGDGSAVFDAVHYACWKLAAYPYQGRVARVLILLSDGEDNFSHRNLKQSIEAAEAAGITVYTINTSVSTEPDSDAN